MATAERPRRRFSVSEYDRIAESGILKPTERVELIDGEIIVMSPTGSRHAACVDRLSTWLHDLLKARAILRVQGPLRLDDLSEPEPDLIALRPRSDFYASGHPGAGDCYLVIEVSETSASYDRGTKLPLYVRAGVPEVWLVDLNRELVESYRGPLGELYTENRTLPRGQSLAPEAFPDAVLGVDAILG
jgi:Uma2 family endonuclease